jgi:hypothetical protein
VKGCGMDEMQIGRGGQTSALYEELPPGFKAWHKVKRELQSMSKRIRHQTLDSVH